MATGSKLEMAARALDEGNVALSLRLAGEALGAAPADPRALNLKARALAAEARHEEALSAYAAAVSAAPESAAYRTDYGNALIAAGEMDSAEAELREALNIDPGFALAIGALAWMKRAEPGDVIIDRLEILKTADGVSNADFIKYAYALGKCYDDTGDYDRAFANYREANDRAQVAYNPADIDRLLGEIRSAFTPAFFAANRRSGWESAKPSFVLGMPRGGSTLLAEKLSEYTGARSLGESGEIIRIASALTKSNKQGSRYPQWLTDVPPRAFDGLGRIYLEKFERTYPDAAHFVDKSLMNFAYVGFIKTILPDAPVFEARRNPLDTCLSCYFHELNRGHHYSFDLASLGHFYRFYTDVMAHWRDHLEVETVQYEDFVAEPDPHLAHCAQRMGATGGKTSPEGATRYVQTWSAVQVRQPVYKTSVARWKNYEKHLAPLIDALGDLAG